MVKHKSAITLFTLGFIVGLFSFSVAGGLIYSTYLGGSGDDYAFRIAVDTAGNAYITGYTNSPDFPTTVGVVDTTLNQVSTDTVKTDTFVTKINVTGTELVYSTYLGGSNIEYGYGIAIDSAGESYLTGYTASTDFPITATAFDTTYHASGAYVSKLSSDGSELLYSAILKGVNWCDIVIDNIGNAYITGQTNSPDFPVTNGAFITATLGLPDAFVSKLNTLSAGSSSLVYSTFLGGSDQDFGDAITIDNAGNAYITGLTNSHDFPTTAGAFDTTLNGLDAFVTKLNADGSALVYSTFLAGDWQDQGYDIVVDGSGNAYITGFTNSKDFPTTPGAYQTSNVHDTYCFVSKFNTTGSALVYSTLLGANFSYGISITLDMAGNAVVTGTTSSMDFPTTIGAFDTTFNGGSIYNQYDAFVTKLNATGSALLYSTFLGGSGGDHGKSIALDNTGNAYIAGYTESSTDFPVSAGTFDSTFNGGSWDAFFSKLWLGIVNNYSSFALSSDTDYWLFEKYGNVIGAGSLSWIMSYNGQSGVIQLTQNPGEKGKLTQVFSVPTSGWYTAIAKVATDIGEVSQQQKAYLYLQELDNDTTIIATANQVVTAGNGGFSGAGVWKDMQISFYAQGTLLGVQVVGIDPNSNNITGSLYIDNIEVYIGASQPQTELIVNNSSFDEGTTDWVIQSYGDAVSRGEWIGWEGLLLGTQGPGEKAKISQLFNCSTPGKSATGSVWVYSGATTTSETQKVYLYLYSYDNGYTKNIESGNAILQPGKWIPGQWYQLQFGCLPLTAYNAVQLVAINPAGYPYQAIYFDTVEVKQD